MAYDLLIKNVQICDGTGARVEKRHGLTARVGT
jgi:N-acyl-D-aspartate/D-glutamate deacylase